MLIACHPIGTSRDQLNGIIHGPKQALSSATVAPAFLVAQYHGLRVKKLSPMFKVDGFKQTCCAPKFR